VELEKPEYAPIVVGTAIDKDRRKHIESPPNGDVRYRYDVFLPPEEEKPVPAVVVLLPSYDRIGSVLADELSNRGFVAVVVRVQKDIVYPDAVIEARDAVRWLRKNSKEYHVDPAGIALVGPHQVGVWAAHAALTRDDPLLERLEGTEKDSAVANGVVLLNAQLTQDGISVGDSFFSRGLSIDMIDENPYWPRLRSSEVFFPAERISKDAPPILFIYNPDLAIRPEIIEFRHNLRRAGVRNELVIMKHPELAFWWREPWFSATVDEIDRFCKSLDKDD
jgi:pectinesterase